MLSLAADEAREQEAEVWTEGLIADGAVVTPGS